MDLRVLGCYGAELLSHQTCGFLINESLLLDAGTICQSLALSEQRKIQSILISHIHLDHTKGLSSLSENLQPEHLRKPVVLMGLKKVLDGLQKNLFNGQLWPDFTRLPNRENPIFQMKAMHEEETIQVSDLEVTAFAVKHTVPSSGFIIRDQTTSFLYSGDTCQTERIWKAAAQDDRLKAALIEVSFPNSLIGLAIESKHLTPNLLLKEFRKIGKPDLPLYAYHMKPRYRGMIRQELEDLGIANMNILEDGMTLHF